MFLAARSHPTWTWTARRSQRAFDSMEAIRSKRLDRLKAVWNSNFLHKWHVSAKVACTCHFFHLPFLNNRHLQIPFLLNLFRVFRRPILFVKKPDNLNLIFYLQQNLKNIFRIRINFLKYLIFFTVYTQYLDLKTSYITLLKNLNFNF